MHRNLRASAKGSDVSNSSGIRAKVSVSSLENICRIRLHHGGFICLTQVEVDRSKHSCAMDYTVSQLSPDFRPCPVGFVKR